MEESGLIGIEARSADGGELGRISEVVTDEETGEVTHVMVESGEENVEVPISRLVLEPGDDFATVGPESPDSESEDDAPEEALPGEEESEQEGRLVAEPESPNEAVSESELDSEDRGDEDSTPVDSGYPRTDAYIDPETGEALEGYAEAADAPSLEEAVDLLLEDTGMRALSISDGVVELSGNAARSEDLDRVAAGITALEEVFEVDTSGVTVG